MAVHRPEVPAAPVSALDAHVGFWLRRVSNRVSRRFAGLVEAHGVSVSEWVALRRLYDRGGAAPGELVASLGMTKGAVSKIVDRLEARGLATRVPDAVDRRHVFVALTPAGRALTVTLAALADENDAHFFGHLPEPARAALVALLADVADRHAVADIPID